MGADDLLSAREDAFWTDWIRPVPGDVSQAQVQERRVQAWLQALRVAQSPLAAAASVAPPWRPPPPGTLAVSLFPGAQQLHLIFSDARGQRAQSLPLAADDMARRVGQLLLELGRQAPQRRLAPLLRQWHAELAVPLLAEARRAGATQLQLSLFGALRYLPLAALDAGRGPLGAQLSLVQQVDEETSTSAAKVVGLRVQVFAVTQSLAGLPELPSLAEEVCHIVRGPVEGGRACPAGALPGQAWLNDSFTREQFGLAARGGGNLLHVGTHFMLRPGHMGRSWLLLGNGERLTLDELAGLDFSQQALVTLSACETGLGGAELQGTEVAGLNRLVIRRGAAAVLASLWRVDDASTAVLMAAFYRGLARGLTPSVALQQAQARLRADRRWAHPYHWSGFYLAQRS